MTGSVAIDVVIGLVFIYLLYSLFATVLVELIATIFQLRAKNLHKAICRMLDDGKTKIFSDKFYKQPLIKYLASGRFNFFNKPSYISGKNFSKGLIQLLKENENASGNTPEDRIKSVIKSDTINDTETAKFIKSLFEDADYDLEKFKVYLENWFNDTMERASGWYKNNLQFITFAVGFTIAFIFNVDTIQIVNKLSKDPKAREQFVQMSETLIKDATLLDQNDKERLKDRYDKLYAMSTDSQEILSIRRDYSCIICVDRFYNLLGIIITAIALSLGAPFWFDLLNKFVNLRGTGQKPKESK